MAIFRFSYVFVSKVNIICVIADLDLQLPKMKTTISEDSVIILTLLAGSNGLQSWYTLGQHYVLERHAACSSHFLHFY